MRRRDFISLLGAVAVLCATRSRAQQPSKTYLIGVLTAQIPSLIKALKDGLRKLGYIEGQNLKVEYRFVTSGGASAEMLACYRAGEPWSRYHYHYRYVDDDRSKASDHDDPYRNGARSGCDSRGFARPGGKVTGTMLYGTELAGKRIDVFKAAVPAIARIAVLGTRSQLTQLLWPQTQTAAGPLGLEARLFTVQDREELSATFDAIAQHNANSLFVLPDPLFYSARQMIIALAAKHRLPAVYEDREYVLDGGLISYGPNIAEMTRRSAAFVDKILKGAKPGDLPIEAPTEYELVINLKTANTLGLSIPEKLLIVADEVIE